MAIDFPTNTITLIVAALFISAGGSWLALSQGLSALDVAPHIKRNWRLGAAFVLIAWLSGPLGYALALSNGTPLPVSAIVAFLASGLLMGLLPLLFSPLYRKAIHAIPSTWLVALHTTRILGFGFLALMDMKLLPAEFALPAGYGDMIVGALALGVVYLIVQQSSYARPLAIVWNGLGLLDFVGALVTGILFIGPFAIQLATAGQSVSYLNFVLVVPSFGVPLYTLLHIYSLFQIFSKRVDVTKGNAEQLPLRQYA